ncbi:MAG: prepilin-type N-terminal cleavage/methylation domain-containing protein [Puniceicoccales bacterium]|jgi:prepilin-type N-terminal cleavage/methylation domain-containing protein|nr:prepilin-type N-terminal cleavage/methylation domain-containing protein [Puniceicoccales bacterium]
MEILKQQKAFTLIELIVVMSIIVILMSIIIPGTQKVLVNARKTKAQTCMRQIAEAYCRYYQTHGFIPEANNIVDLIEKFAEEGELNSTHLFVFPGDTQAPKVLREQIWPKDGDNPAWEIGKPLSVELVSKIQKEVNPSTIPVVFSRGLDYSNGFWNPNNGVWKNEGGFIGFLDGKVRWYKNLSGDDGIGVLSLEATGTHSAASVISAIGGEILEGIVPDSGPLL